MKKNSFAAFFARKREIRFLLYRKAAFHSVAEGALIPRRSAENTAR